MKMLRDYDQHQQYVFTGSSQARLLLTEQHRNMSQYGGRSGTAPSYGGMGQGNFNEEIQRPYTSANAHRMERNFDEREVRPFSFKKTF